MGLSHHATHSGPLVLCVERPVIVLSTGVILPCQPSPAMQRASCVARTQYSARTIYSGATNHVIMFMRDVLECLVRDAVAGPCTDIIPGIGDMITKTALMMITKD